MVIGSAPRLKNYYNRISINNSNGQTEKEHSMEIEEGGGHPDGAERE